MSIPKSQLTLQPKLQPKSGQTTFTPIPNELTILINTRIRQAPKIKYTPSMSIPNERSKSVYFDPIIKLNSSIINTIPPGLPKSELLTQFFSKNAFNSLLKRTLASTYQPDMSLETATQKGIVDNNIKLTLNALFKKNNLFYINGYPFTVFSYDWLNGDRQIDTKPLDISMAGPQRFGLNSLAQLEYKKRYYATGQSELDSIPESIRKGSVSTNISKFAREYRGITDVGMGLGESIEETKDQPQTKPVEDSSPFTNPSEENLNNVPRYLREILENMVIESALKLSPNTTDVDSDNIAVDTVTVTILYPDDATFSADRKTNRSLNALYTKYIEQQQLYTKAVDNFAKVRDIVMKFKTMLDNTVNSLVEKITASQLAGDKLNQELHDSSAMSENIQLVSHHYQRYK